MVERKITTINAIGKLAGKKGLVAESDLRIPNMRGIMDGTTKRK